MKCICPDFCQENKILRLKPSEIQYCCQSSSGKNTQEEEDSRRKKGCLSAPLEFYLFDHFYAGRQGIVDGVEKEQWSICVFVYFCICIFDWKNISGHSVGNENRSCLLVLAACHGPLNGEIN